MITRASAPRGLAAICHDRCFMFQPRACAVQHNRPGRRRHVRRAAHSWRKPLPDDWNLARAYSGKAGKPRFQPQPYDPASSATILLPGGLWRESRTTLQWSAMLLLDETRAEWRWFNERGSELTGQTLLVGPEPTRSDSTRGDLNQSPLLVHI